MNLRLTIPFLAALAAIVSCDKGLESDGPSGPAVSGQSFRAVTEVPVPAGSTKAFDPAVKAFRFEIGDEIAVSDGTVTSIFVATSLTDSDVSFTLKAGETALADEGVTYKAYYPASIAPGLSGVAGQSGCYMMQQQVNSNGDIPDGKTVNYSESRYESNPMYAESSTKDLQFKNLCALLCVTLAQPEGTDNAISQLIFQCPGTPMFGPFEEREGVMTISSSGPDYGRIATKNSNAKYISASNKYYIAIPQGTYSAAEFIVQNNKRMKQHYFMKEGSSLTVERNKIYNITLQVDDLRYDLTDGDAILGISSLGTYSPSNCYLIHAISGGKYCFKATRGPVDEPLEGVASVEVLWRAQISKTMTAEQVVMDDGLEYRNGYVYFTTSNNQGNALIGARDAEGKLLWSWHIWLLNSSDEPSVQTYPNGSVVLDRNVGAIAGNFDEGDNTNYHNGLYYQYGRKEPFPTRTGSTTAVSPWSGTTTLERTVVTEQVTIEDAIQNPGKLYCIEADWTSDPAASWDTQDKSIYDPCPSGYRVWTKACWANYSIDDVTVVSGATISSKATNAGYTLNLPESVAYYPVTGYTKWNDGKLTKPTLLFRSWTRENKSYLYITHDTDLKLVSMGAAVNTYSTYAQTVRCERIQ